MEKNDRFRPEIEKNDRYRSDLDKNDRYRPDLADDAAAKESDLLRLLNEADRPSNPLTPLTKAVQMVAAAEQNYLKRSPEDEQEDEEGPDFFETMRHLNAPKVERPGPPVSQHHPLHYGDLDEDLMEYGVYAYQRELPETPYGGIPFNPS